MRFLNWIRERRRVPLRTSGFLILLLFILLPLALKVVFGSGSPPAKGNDEKIYAWIKGAVKHPGVYPISPEWDLPALISRAGGLKVDGVSPEFSGYCTLKSGIIIKIQEDPDGWRLFQDEMSAFHKVTLGIPLSINRESQEGLTAIPGIGPGLARIIIRERIARGGFKNLNDIKSLYGVGKRVYKKIIPYVKL